MRNKIKLWAPALALVLAAVLFAGGTVGNVRAALTYYSDNYDIGINVPMIGVTLEENGRSVAWRNYLPNGREDTGSRALLRDAGRSGFRPGEYYDERLAVLNSGGVDAYVKVEVFKYWTDERGNKITTLEPAQIDFALGTGSNWYVDEDASTAERTVLYYELPLAPGERSTDLSQEIMMDGSVLEKISETVVKSDENGQTIRVEYAYDGVRMCVDADVYAVQAHNAQAAIKSAWGKNVSVSSGGGLSFQN